MNKGFADHFSGQSRAYARYRPNYPAALFRWLAEMAPSRCLAWDCATGSGQAALGLADHFQRIIASDPSHSQLLSAGRHPRTDYLQATAEASGLADACLDLITVAQALHWFNLGAFYAEVRRVLRPQGVLAVWSYQLLRCEPGIDALIDRFDRDIVGPYWPPERRLVDDGYRSLPFPFASLPTPEFSMQAEWDLEQLLGYLGTWSSGQAYRRTLKRDPLDLLLPDLAAAWGDPAHRRTMDWPLVLRVGRVD